MLALITKIFLNYKFNKHLLIDGPEGVFWEFPEWTDC